MDTTTVLPATIAVAACLLTILSIVLAPSFITRRARGIVKVLAKQLKEDAADVPDLLYDLRTAQARVAGTIRTARKQLGERDDTDDDEPRDAGPIDLAGLMDSPIATGIVAGFGLDADKLRANDPAEVAKAAAEASKRGLNLARLARGDSKEVEKALDVMFPSKAAQPAPPKVQVWM